MKQKFSINIWTGILLEPHLLPECLIGSTLFCYLQHIHLDVLQGIPPVIVCQNMWFMLDSTPMQLWCITTSMLHILEVDWMQWTYCLASTLPGSQSVGLLLGPPEIACLSFACRYAGESCSMDCYRFCRYCQVCLNASSNPKIIGVGCAISFTDASLSNFYKKFSLLFSYWTVMHCLYCNPALHQVNVFLLIIDPFVSLDVTAFISICAIFSD